jgi:hypothetical protein
LRNRFSENVESPQDIHRASQKGVTPSRAPPSDTAGTPHYLRPVRGLKPGCLQIYASGDSVVTLDAHTLALVRVLAFWEAFPGLRHGGEEINSLAVDSGMKIVRTKSLVSGFKSIHALKVVAAMESRIACWSLSGGKAAVWRIHSTLALSKDTTITALDCKSGNSILFTVIVVPLCGDLNTRIARHWNQRRPVCPYSQP